MSMERSRPKLVSGGRTKTCISGCVPLNRALRLLVDGHSAVCTPITEHFGLDDIFPGAGGGGAGGGVGGKGVGGKTKLAWE